tara:strand:+ start:359 stop:625 length:267 start_codon:yes stop_codon:yes gene_type:complete
MSGPDPIKTKSFLKRNDPKSKKFMDKRKGNKIKNPLFEDDDIPTRLQKKETTIDEVKMAKGGRAGYKDGSKGCKMATKGKGRAYGKNS